MLNISKVEALIAEHGWKKAYFCRLFNHSRTWIDDWKRGRGLPDANTLQAIADKLDTTVDYLTDKTDRKEKPNAYNVNHFAEKHGEPTELEKVLEQQPGLMFRGIPLTEDDRAKLITAMRAVMAIEDKKSKK